MTDIQKGDALSRCMTRANTQCLDYSYVSFEEANWINNNSAQSVAENGFGNEYV